MKKRTLAVAIATTLFCASLGTLPISNVKADDSNTVNIAVDEPFSSLDIFSITEYSSSVDWIFKMTYDTLLTLDEEGNLQPGLAKEWRTVPSEGGDDDEEEFEIISGSSFDLSAWEWDTTYPPGWSEGQDADYNPDTAKLEFLTGTGPLTVEFRLREDIKFHCGCNFDADALEMFLLNVKQDASSDSLIAKQWSAIIDPPIEDMPYSSIHVVDDYTIQLQLKFSDKTFGWIDFLYSLASPMASIVEAYSGDGYNVAFGTGAYTVKKFENGYVELEPNENWKLGDVPTQNVSFTYIDVDNGGNTSVESDTRAMSLLLGDMDVAVLSPNGYAANSAYTTKAVADDPLFLCINSESTQLADADVRRALAYAVMNDSKEYDENYYGAGKMGIQNSLKNNEINPIFNNTLTYDVNGLWTRDEKHYNTIEGDLDYLEYIYSNLKDLELQLLTSLDSYHLRVALKLEEVLENFGMTIELVMVEESELDRWRESGIYDLAVTEIEVSNMNSVYNETYSVLDSGAQELLDWSKKSGNLATYQFMFGQIAVKVDESAYWINLGWQQKLISYGSNVSGITFPVSGFNPTGDVSRIDFKGVTKTA